MLIALRDDFYGVFCANNTPDLANFPHGVKFQRNVDFPSKTLRGVNGVTIIPPSIDPFFFRYRRYEDRISDEHGERQTRGVVVRNLRYERVDIGELEIGEGAADRREPHERKGRELAEIAEEIARLVERLRRLGDH